MYILSIQKAIYMNNDDQSTLRLLSITISLQNYFHCHYRFWFICQFRPALVHTKKKSSPSLTKSKPIAIAQKPKNKKTNLETIVVHSKPNREPKTKPNTNLSTSRPIHTGPWDFAWSANFEFL
jgi:hypothetical protein